MRKLLVCLALALALASPAFAQSAGDLVQSVTSSLRSCASSECRPIETQSVQLQAALCGTATLTSSWPQQNYFYSGAGVASFKVNQTGFTCTFPAPTIGVSWLHVDTTNNTTYVRLYTDNNTSTASRVTTITIAGQLFTVFQEAAVATPPVAPTPPTVTVAAGGSIQAALDALPDGGILQLTPGASYTQNVIFRNRTGAVTLTTQGFAVPAGTRVSPTDAPTMANIVCADCLLPTIGFEPGAHDVTIIGIDVTGNPVHTDRPTIVVGNHPTTWASPATLADEPTNITFDRVYEHADTTGGRQGIRVDGINVKVLNSYISGFWLVGADSQAVGMINGAGPLLVQNSYLEASGENFLVGGADPSIPNLIPSDLTFIGNYFFKPLSWKTAHPGSVKNLFELKNAQRVVVDRNTFENVWVDGQPGSAILFTIRNQDGACTWCVVKDVTFTNNVIKNVANYAFNILGMDDRTAFPSGVASNLVIKNNLILNSVNGVLLQSPTNGFEMSHNTFVGITGKFFAFGHITTGSVVTAFVFKDNAVQSGDYGITGDGTTGLGTASLEANVAAGYVFLNNVIEKSAARFIAYPSGNYVIAAGTYLGKLNAQYGMTDVTCVATDGTLSGVDTTKLPQ
jgi:hypothetical protein